MASVWSDIDPTLRATVTKSSDTRLQEKIITALVDVDPVRVKALSRAELIYNVCLIRRQLGITNTAQTAVKDKSEFAHLYNVKLKSVTSESRLYVLGATPAVTPVGTPTSRDAPPLPATPTLPNTDMLAQLLMHMQ